MTDNDLTGKYMSSREGSIITPAQRFRMEQNETPQAEKHEEPARLNVPESKGFLESVVDVGADIAGGIIESPRQVAGGVLEATKQLAKTMESLIPLGTLNGGEVTEDSFIEADKPRTTTGGLIRGVSQFLTGFIPATKAIKALGATSAIGTALGGGAVADALVFDPHEQRLSDLVEEFPALQNPVTGYLQSDPNDSAAEGMFKNAVEGLGLGAATEAFTRGVKLIRAGRIAKLEADELASSKATAEALTGVEAQPQIGKDLTVPAKEGDFIPFKEKASQVEKEFKQGSKKADPERAANINIANIDSTDDVDKIINAVADKDNLNINAERREVITHEETKKLADDLGMTVEGLLDRRRGQAFNAEQAVAARNLLVASGENLINLAKKAATGSDEEVALFRRAMSQHSAIQAQVSGLTAEAGRALGSFRINAVSSAGQQRAIKEALDAGGGAEFSKEMAAKVSQLSEAHQINAAVKGMMGAKTKDMFFEAWINGLLSSPATHAVNVLSNSIVAGWSAGERKVASMIGRTLDNQSIPDGEISAQLKGMVEGSKDGMRLAWNAIKTGEPSDAATKIETQGFRAITAENLNLSGTPGQFADFLGETVRVPGRLLTAGDELFKTIGYRMELNAQAYRTAFNEGLRDESLALRMNDIINNPPENLHIQAVDASRYQTFTKELGEAGKSVQTAVRSIPGARVIVPFIRTPTNIMKYVGERTVLAPIAKGVREEIAAGGARRDMALAKIATGSMVMAAAADYSLSGQITGGGPKNPQMINILRATGWQPYSIKVGDEYYAYSRLDPIGALIGISADMAEIIGQTTEADALDLATAATISVAQNVTSKTYLSGVSQFFDVMSSTSSDPEKNNKKAKRWIERMAGSLIPAGVAQVTRTMDPTLRSTQGILEKLQSRIPGYSNDLPPRRNIFGEPIVLSGGLGPDIMSPIYASSDKKDPIADEIVAQQTLLRMPHRAINGVELDTKQYDRYIVLYSGKDNRFSDVPLKTKLSEMFRSDGYMNATEGQEGGKSVFIRTVFEAYRESAKAQMMDEYPELKMSIMKLKTMKAQKLTGAIQ